MAHARDLGGPGAHNGPGAQNKTCTSRDMLASAMRNTHPGHTKQKMYFPEYADVCCEQKHMWYISWPVCTKSTSINTYHVHQEPTKETTPHYKRLPGFPTPSQTKRGPTTCTSQLECPLKARTILPHKIHHIWCALAQTLVHRACTQRV